MIDPYQSSHYLTSHTIERLEILTMKIALCLNQRKKYGKAYTWDGSPMGESFRDNFISSGEEIPLIDGSQQYKYVTDSESLLPDGYYSWWGIYTSEQLRKHHLQLDNDFRPPYLKYPPTSPYGNREFIGDLHTLLRCYQESRTTDAEPDIFLLVGGTLRYTYEICFVVIVCTGEDKESEALKGYRPLLLTDSKEPVLVLNNLTDEHGKVTFSGLGACIPIFYPRFLVSNKSWANLAFAFYFNNTEGALKCRKEPHIRESSIGHDRCNKTQPTSCDKWCCPNDMTV